MNKVYFVLLEPWFLMVRVYLGSNSHFSAIHIKPRLHWCQLDRLDCGEEKRAALIFVLFIRRTWIPCYYGDSGHYVKLSVKYRCFNLLNLTTLNSSPPDLSPYTLAIYCGSARDKRGCMNGLTDREGGHKWTLLMHIGHAYKLLNGLGSSLVLPLCRYFLFG